MKLTEEKAILSFKSGLNCAQAVVTGYSDSLNFDNSLALNISSGFGGGMGHLFGVRCEKCISDAIKIVDSLIEF